MNNFRYGIVVSAVVGLGASVAWGGPMILDADDRRVDMSMMLNWIDTNGDWHWFSDFGYHYSAVQFNPWLLNEELVSPVSVLNATHQSSVSDMEIAGSGSVSNGMTSDETLIDIGFTTFGQSATGIRFTLAEQTAFRVEADLFSNGYSATSTVWVRNADMTGDYFYARADQNQSHVVVNEELVLEAGSYYYEIRSEVHDTGLWSEGEAAYSGSLRVIPSPSGILVFACGGLVAFRRRR